MANLIVPVLMGATIITPIYAGLNYFNVIKSNPTRKANVLNIAMLASAAYLFLFVMINSTVITIMQSWFFDGRIMEKQIFIPADENYADHYETELFFRYLTKPAINAKGAVTFLILFCFVGGFALNYYFSSQYAKSKKSDADYETESKFVVFLIITRLVLGTGLLICLLDMPYRYYDIFRFIMLIGCCYLALDEHLKANFWGWLFFVLVAILFNPIYEIYLTKLLWNVIDIGIAVIMLTGAVKKYIDNRN